MTSWIKAGYHFLTATAVIAQLISGRVSFIREILLSRFHCIILFLYIRVSLNATGSRAIRMCPWSEAAESPEAFPHLEAVDSSLPIL